jgi:hypothetical protein
MPRVLHLLKGDSEIARAAIGAGVAGGDRVTVALLPGAPDTGLPAGVTVRRVPDDASWEELFDLIFEAESVVAW